MLATSPPGVAMPRATGRSVSRTYAVTWRSGAALLLLALLLVGVGGDKLPLLLFLYYLGAGFASYVLCGLDKRAAIRGEWRIAEATLHSVDLAGGVIGGLLAQLAFWHKIAKPKFGAASALIAVVHGLGLGAALAGFVQLPGLG